MCKLKVAAMTLADYMKRQATCLRAEHDGACSASLLMPCTVLGSQGLVMQQHIACLVQGCARLQQCRSVGSTQSRACIGVQVATRGRLVNLVYMHISIASPAQAGSASKGTLLGPMHLPYHSATYRCMHILKSSQSCRGNGGVLFSVRLIFSIG